MDTQLAVAVAGAGYILCKFGNKNNETRGQTHFDQIGRDGVPSSFIHFLNKSVPSCRQAKDR